MLFDTHNYFQIFQSGFQRFLKILIIPTAMGLKGSKNDPKLPIIHHHQYILYQAQSTTRNFLGQEWFWNKDTSKNISSATHERKKMGSFSPRYS